MSKKKLYGIMENGYGIVPKKLMKLQLDKQVGKEKGKNVKLVLCYLLSYSGSGNFAFPSIQLICKDLEMSKPTVIKALHNSEKLGLITIERKGKGRGNVYILDFLSTDYIEND